jgi:hypothetical protein
LLSSSTSLLAIRSVGILFLITIAIHDLGITAMATIEAIEIAATTTIAVGVIAGVEWRLLIGGTLGATIRDRESPMNVGDDGWWKITPWEMCRSGLDERTAPAETVDQAPWLAPTGHETATGPTEGQARLIVVRAFRSIESCGAPESGMDANSAPTFRLLRAALALLKLVLPV